MADEVTLREVRPEDLPVLFEHQRDPEANRMADFPARDREAFMAHWTKILADPSLTTRTILHDGAIAGNVVSWDAAGQRLVGYWIARKDWGKGIATRALRAFLTVVTARPLHAHVAKHNIGSIRVLEKCGFRREAEEPHEYVMVLER
ncbi:MAG TPA: GNAT family N-acetyltransferase [Candidatus Polarisedimenticolaceae bacterium]|nr:GNAT family N-acetyltransferase [Candidatus Polarisedimenticolaceae bacterium]